MAVTSLANIASGLRGVGVGTDWENVPLEWKKCDLKHLKILAEMREGCDLLR